MSILLKEGATLVTSAEDILNEYDLKLKKNITLKMPENLDIFSKKIVEKINAEPQNIDDLCSSLRCKMTDLLSSISLLELQGIIEKNTDGTFALKS